MSSENEILAIQELDTSETQITRPLLPEQDAKSVNQPESHTSQETDNEDSTKEIRNSLANKLIESSVGLLGS